MLPRAARARDILPIELEKRGAEVHVAPAYETVLPEASEAAASQVFDGSRKPDWVTFTSSSAAANFAKLVAADRLEGVRIASIGPITSATIRDHAMRVDVEAREYTTNGLVEALIEEATKASPASG